MDENPIEPLQWRFSQCFGEKGNTDDLTEGKSGDWDEYYEFKFPDDEKAEPKKGNNMRLMEMAKLWKKRKTS